MQPKEVLLVLTDCWADWEAGFAVAGINSYDEYAVKTIAVDKSPKTSMGGLRAEIDYSLDEYRNWDNLTMLILPGGRSWRAENHAGIAEYVKKAADMKIPVAAICGATFFLARHGFLDKVKHTGWSLKSFQGEPNYKGQKLYISEQLVVDGGFITANETASIQFAYEVFKTLGIDSREELDKWYDKFSHGEVRSK